MTSCASWRTYYSTPHHTIPVHTQLLQQVSNDVEDPEDEECIIKSAQQPSTLSMHGCKLAAEECGIHASGIVMIKMTGCQVRKRR